MLLPNGMDISITCTWILAYIAWAVVLRDLFWIRWYHLSRICMTQIYILVVKITDKYYLMRSGDNVRIYSLSLSHFLFRKSNYVTMTYDNTQSKMTSLADDHRWLHEH